MEFRASKQGNHMYIRVFIGKGLDYTLPIVGTLMLSPEEWSAFEKRILRGERTYLGEREEHDLDIVCWQEDSSKAYQTIEVKLADLPKISENSIFRSKCPKCKDGILLVRREPDTLKLSAYDNCISCGQIFFYTDIEEWTKSVGGKR
jgi:uncharacterized protein with PIN domain